MSKDRIFHAKSTKFYTHHDKENIFLHESKTDKNSIKTVKNIKRGIDSNP